MCITYIHFIYILNQYTLEGLKKMQKEELNELLTKAKDLLKNETTKIAYETWIRDLDIESADNGNIVLIANNAFQKESILSRYHDLIKNTFNYLTNRNCEITVLLKDDISEEELQVASKLSNTPNSYPNTTLNPKYTFDSFVVGNSNRFAHAAALAVAEAPATAYNPLFIYGGVGLGKTHLMQAIANEILLNNRNANILYVTSEKFTNQLINAIKDGKNEMFRNKYRNIDVLLIDDIQFIAGKERIQEEFFHTFNTLHENGKQIIISSDKPPKDIKLLEDRLKSRFEWGLIADISNPDYETRLAILRKKAQLDNIIIDDEILSDIATKIDSNIRELEGILNKLIANASLTNCQITIEMAEKAINDVVTKKDKVLSLDLIQETISKYFNITVEELKGVKRSNDVTFPRQIAMYLCRNVAQLPLTKIGEGFGKRDHTTVIHACNKIEKEVQNNVSTKRIVESVKNILLNDK